MKPIKLDLNSRLFQAMIWINETTSVYYRKNEWDTCSLLRHMLYTFSIGLLFRIFPTVFMASLACSLLYLTGVAGYLTTAVVAARLWGYEATNDWIVFLMGFVGGILLVAGVTLFVSVVWVVLETIPHLVRKFQPRRNLEKEPGPIGVLFRSFKEKHCSKITFD